MTTRIEMTINHYIEQLINAGLEKQIVTIYDRHHNIIYHGKADYAPINLYDTFRDSELITTIIDGQQITDLIINGRR